MTPVTRLLLAIAVTACVASPMSCGYEELSDHPCPPGGTTATYENFGQYFFNQWCDYCHSAELDQRRGAPENYVFDSDAAIVQFKDRIFVRAAGENTSMPPGPDDPPAGEREMLADWLACGAP